MILFKVIYRISRLSPFVCKYKRNCSVFTDPSRLNILKSGHDGDKDHINMLIYEIDYYLSTSFNHYKYGSQDITQIRTLCYGLAKSILDNWSIYENALNIEFPSNLNECEKCFYLIQRIQDSILDESWSGPDLGLVPRSITEKLTIVNYMNFNFPYSNNNLNLGKYYIDPILEAVLFDIWKHDRQKLFKLITKEFFYVVVFNKIWNSKLNKYTLVYNYTKYNKIFFNLYYCYITIEQFFLHQFGPASKGKGHIGGYNFFILHDKLKPDSYCELYNLQHNYYRKHDDLHPVYSRKMLDYNFIEFCKASVFGRLLNASFQDMCYIINNLVCCDNNIKAKDNIVNRLYNLFVNVKYGECNREINHHIIIDEHGFNLYDEEKKIYNNLSRFIYIVPNIHELVNTIKKSSDYKDIYPCTKNQRGGQSLIGNTMYELDRNFRHSMYNHHKFYFLHTKCHKLQSYSFSYKNIHCNLGFNKW